MLSDDSAERTTVAFIGGHGRSGSTLLCRLLEGLDGVCSVGELRNLWDNGVLKDYDCACGKPFSQCDFWSKVGVEAFGGWDPETARRALVLRRRVDRLRSVPQLVAASGDFAAAADEYAALIASVYRAAAAVSGARVIVDSSKLPSTGYLMSRSTALDPRVVHLVRDSRGVAFSWTKVVQRGDSDRTMARSAPTRTAVRWGAFNALTAFLGRRGLPKTTVRYEDLIAAPADELARLADFLDVPLAPGALDFVSGETVELPVDHSVWGNPVRSASGPQRLRLDEAWRTGLTGSQRRLVTVLSLPGLVRYGYLTGRPRTADRAVVVPMPDRNAPDPWLDPETTHPPGTPDPVVVLYVGGMPRGGTTLLDLMIGQLPGHVAVGELFYIWLTGLDRDRLCGCGETFHQCPFWQKVGDRAFGGWDQVDLPAVKQLVRRVDRTVYLPLLLAPWLDKRFQARLAEYQRVMTSVYSAIAEVAGASVVVDSSKRPSLAYALRSAPGVDLRLVHMMRDPRGVVQSWSQEVAIPDGAGARDHLKVRSAREVTRRWVTVHTMIGGLLRLGVPGTTIRYEDLVLDPQGAMRAAAAVTGTPLTDGELDFLGEDGLHLSSHHTVAGGRIRFNSSPMPLRLDEKWRREMPARRRRFVEIATWPMRRRHGYH